MEATSIFIISSSIAIVVATIGWLFWLRRQAKRDRPAPHRAGSQDELRQL
jgi:hypothetical protein